jgi:hypothetical protein
MTFKFLLVGLGFPTNRQYRYHVGSKMSNFKGFFGTVPPPCMALVRLALANELLSPVITQ